MILTHWDRVTHIRVSKLTTIGSDNGLSPGRRQAIIWTSAGMLLIGPLGTNFTEILIGIHTFSFKKMHFKMSSGKWRPFCLGLSVLIIVWVVQDKNKKVLTVAGLLMMSSYLSILYIYLHTYTHLVKMMATYISCLRWLLWHIFTAENHFINFLAIWNGVMTQLKRCNLNR